MRAVHLRGAIAGIAVLLICSLLKFVRSCKVQKPNPFDLDHCHIAALILARGGSKSIRLKNLAIVRGKSLLEISLEEILKVPHFDSVWVSTDSEEIYNAAIANSATTNVNIHWRSAESATDEASSIYAVQEFLTWRSEVDVVALVQCTSPFVKHEYLQRALVLLGHSDCVFSVTKSFKLRWRHAGNDTFTAVNFDPARRPRRQDWDGEYVENGMFYFSRRRLLVAGIFQNQKCKIVEIPEQDALEIDTTFHLQLAQHLQPLS